jgi:hypothetical protein
MKYLALGLEDSPIKREILKNINHILKECEPFMERKETTSFESLQDNEYHQLE